MSSEQGVVVKPLQGAAQLGLVCHLTHAVAIA